MFLDLAEMLPDVIFHVAGSANQGSEYERKLQTRADSLLNVKMHGRVSNEKLAMLYAESSILCCTSELEGFPTTFLEAWKQGIPVITTFDPDGIVEDEDVGFSVDTVDQIKEALNLVANNPASYETKSRNAIALYMSRYSPGVIVDQYKTLLNNL